MPAAPVLETGGNAARNVELDESIFGAEIKPHLVHEAVRAEFAAQRSGTRALKTRGMVAGGRSKPWRQKGTGRARAGTTRAVQWTGGGVAFEPRTNFTVKVNRKARKAAFRAALTAHARAGTIAVFDGGAFAEPSTRAASELLAEWQKEVPLIVVVTEDEEAAAKSFRNLAGVVVVLPSELEIGGVVWARSLLVSEAALPAVQGRAAE